MNCIPCYGHSLKITDFAAYILKIVMGENHLVKLEIEVGVTGQRLPLVFSMKRSSNGRLNFENMFELKWASDDIQRRTAHIVVCLSSNLNAGDQR